MANTIRGLLPDGTAPTPLHDQILSIAQEYGTPPGTVPIFATLLEALAWEEANPGRVALTIESQEPDTEPPTSAGILTVEAGDVYARLSVTGAVDDRGITGYSFRVDSGDWSDWSVSPQYTVVDLERSTSYTFQHRVRDAGEHVLEGVGVTVETLATAPLEPGDVITSDGFTGDGTGSRTTDAYSGGIPMPYTGTVTTSGGVLTVANNGTLAHYPAVIAVGRANLNVNVQVTALPTSGTIELSLQGGTPVKAVIGTGGAINVSLNGWHNGVATASASSSVSVEARGSLARLLVDGIEEWTGEIDTSPKSVGIVCRNGGGFDNLVVTAL